MQNDSELKLKALARLGIIDYEYVDGEIIPDTPMFQLMDVANRNITTVLNNSYSTDGYKQVNYIFFSRRNYDRIFNILGPKQTEYKERFHIDGIQAQLEHVAAGVKKNHTLKIILPYSDDSNMHVYGGDKPMITLYKFTVDDKDYLLPQINLDDVSVKYEEESSVKNKIHIVI